MLPWQAAIGLLAHGPLLAAGVALAGLRPVEPHGARHAPWWPRFGPVLALPGVRAYIAGYAVHCWELFGLRSWMVAFIAFAYAASGAAAPWLSPTDAAALTAGLVAAAPLAQRGAAMALYSLLGFGAGFVAPLVFGATLDVAGGATSATAWTLAFATLGAGCLLWAAVVRGREREAG